MICHLAHPELGSFEKVIMNTHLKVFDRWYEKIKSTARHKNAEKVLIGTAFLESSVFLLPVDALSLIHI